MPMCSSSASTFFVKPPPFLVPPQVEGFHKFSSVSRVSTRFCFLETKRSSSSSSSSQQLKPHRICSTIGNGDKFSSVSRVSTRFCFLETKRSSSSSSSSSSQQLKPHRICSTIGNGDASDISDVHKSSADQEGLKENNGSQHTKSFSFNESMKRLRKYGTSGVLSYGLLNTAYYLVTFLFVWFYVAPAPVRMGYAAAVQRFLKIMAMVWAGSQVTKLARVAGALALAPVVDRGLSWFTIRFKFQSQAKAFMAIVGACFGLALMLFFVVTLLCA